MNRIPRCVSRVVQAVLMFVVAPLAGSALAAVPYSEDWSAGDTNGWIQGTTSTTILRDNGFGNPAGSLVLRRILEAPIFPLGATSELPAVSGDYTGQPAWMISFDVSYDIGNFSDTLLRFRYQDATFNGWHLDVADVFPAGWQSYSAMFDPSWTDAEATASGWVDETGGAVSWQLLMSNVYHPEVRFILGDELSAIGHVDNFVLKAVVPEPATATVFLTAVCGLALVKRRSRRG